MKKINYFLLFLQTSVVALASYLYYAHLNNIFVLGNSVIGITEIAFCSIAVWGLSVLISWISAYILVASNKKERIEAIKMNEVYSTQLHELYNFSQENKSYFYHQSDNIEKTSEVYIKSIPYMHEKSDVWEKKYIETAAFFKEKDDEIQIKSRMIVEQGDAISSLETKVVALQDENARLIEKNVNLISQCSQNKNSKKPVKPQKKARK